MPSAAGWVCSWREYLRQDDDSQTPARLRRRESTGRPLGDESFLRKIGRVIGRDLVPRKPGPVPKKAKRKQR